MVRFIDWFAGLGGFRHGLERANERRLLRQQDMQGCGADPYECGEHGGQAPGGHLPQESHCRFTCVGACEIDKWCRRVYAKNFGHEPEWGDSRAVDPASLPDFDLLCAGFPCQSFSVAGKRRGLRDPRGTLFFEIIRVCGDRRPAYLLLENVKGVLSDDSGFTFETILASLSGIGYDCQWEVLNSKNFGVPQNRERVFIVGHLRGVPRPQVFPLGEDAGLADGTSGGEGKEIATALRSHQSGGHGDAEMTLIACNQRKEIRATPQAMALSADGPGSRRGQMTNVVLRQIGNIYESKADAGRVYSAQGIARTLKGEAGGLGGKTGLYTDGLRLRRLTPLECERLQGLPDGWTEGVSDTQRYRMLGNAVTVNVIEAIGVRFADALGEAGWTGII